jgi:hypothetical protein
MHHCEYGDLIVFEDIVDGVGETPYQGSPDLLVSSTCQARVASNEIESSLHFRQEILSQLRDLGLIPGIGFCEVRLCLLPN